MTLSLPRPDDWHVHLRQGESMASFARVHGESFGRILAMPNTLPPLVGVEEIQKYRQKARKAASGLEVLTAFRIMPDTKAGDIGALSEAGIPAGKYYPEGATTNSSGGLTGWRQIEEALGAMEEKGLVLSIHGEDPSAPVLEREEAFLPVFREIKQAFPGLKMVLEHVSTAAGVQAVREAPGPTAATVTLHHLLFTLEDLLGGRLNPHLFCKPLVKSDKDRRVIQERLLVGDERFFFGSDSAPHPAGMKESGSIPAGIYSAPVILPVLAGWFEEKNALERMEAFLCYFGRNFYGMEANPGRVELERETWKVPDLSEGCVPLLAGEELRWRVSG